MPDARTITLDRRYPATPEQVWRAWTNPQVLARWFGCAADMLWTIHEWDPTPGGRLRVSLVVDDGPVEVVGVFLDVEPPRLLRYSFGSPDQIVTVIVSPQENETLVTVEHRGHPDEDQCTIVTDGWTHSLAALAATLNYGAMP